MKCLKATSSGEIRVRNALLGYWWYEKTETDKAIAELKGKLEDVQASYDYKVAAERWKKEWEHIVDVLVHRNHLLSRIFFHNRTKTLILDYDRTT